MEPNRKEPPASNLPSRLISVEDITDSVAGHVEFDASERKEILSFMKLEGLDTLRLDYDIMRLDEGRFELNGRIRAQLAQSCVITLEPVAETIDESVMVELLSEERLKAREEAEIEAGPEAKHDDPPLAIIDDKADVGAFAIEMLANALNPYPRKENAEFDWKDPASGPDGEKLNPFAELGKLKRGD